MANPISKYYQSFSGTDTIAFLMMPGCIPIVIGSLTTISYSMYRNKKPVINIGRTNINGVTRGSRIFAGTMVFTLINQHWLRELQTQWSEKYDYGNAYLAGINELKVDELPLFDIMIVSANEYGSAVSMFIFGIDFTDEAQTISVEDLFTENTFSFIARDISVFKKFSTDPNAPNGTSSDQLENATIGSIDPLKSFLFDNDNFDWSDVDNSIKEYLDTKDVIDRVLGAQYEYEFMRELYYNNSLGDMFRGKDVILVQNRLKQLGLYDNEISGFFDEATAEAVKKYQSQYNLDPNGKVDRTTWNSLFSYTVTNGGRSAIVINKNGTNAYSEPDLSSNINYHYAYNDFFSYDEVKKIVDDQGVVRYFLKNKNGWVYANDIYSSNFDNGTVEFPTLKPDADNQTAYIVMLQNALSTVYKDFKSFKYGVYDEETIKYVNKFKDEYGNKYGLADKKDEVDQGTWTAIEDVAGGNFVSDEKDEIVADMTKRPGRYKIKAEQLEDFSVKFMNDSPVNAIMTGITHFKDGSVKSIAQNITVGKKYNTKIGPWSGEENNPIIATTCLDEDGKWKNAEWAEFIISPGNGDPYKWIFYFDQ